MQVYDFTTASPGPAVGVGVALSDIAITDLSWRGLPSAAPRK